MFYFKHFELLYLFNCAVVGIYWFLFNRIFKKFEFYLFYGREEVFSKEIYIYVIVRLLSFLLNWQLTIIREVSLIFTNTYTLHFTSRQRNLSLRPCPDICERRWDLSHPHGDNPLLRDTAGARQRRDHSAGAGIPYAEDLGYPRRGSC